MIYVIKENDLIKITDLPRTEEEKEYTELLYTIEYNDLENIYSYLRPFISLYKNDIKYYKYCSEIISYFENKKYLNSSIPDNQFVYEEEINNTINNCINIIRIFNSLGFSINVDNETEILFIERKNIRYDCDILNYLEDRFGKNIVGLVEDYKKLSQEKKTFLNDFSKLNTRERKLIFINQELQKFGEYSNLLEFIPKWYRLNLKLFGTYNSDVIGNEKNLEFKNLDKLGKIDEDIETRLKNMMFSNFDLGKVYTGNVIKEKVQDIYDTCGIKKTAKINDIFKYFRVVKVNLNQESSYRISTRQEI